MKTNPKQTKAGRRGKKPTPAELAAVKFKGILASLEAMGDAPKTRAFVPRLDAELEAVARLRLEVLAYEKDLVDWLAWLQSLIHSAESVSHADSLDERIDRAAKTGAEPPDAWIAAQQADWRDAGEALAEIPAPAQPLPETSHGFNFTASDRDAIERFLEFIWRGGSAEGKVARVNDAVVAFLALSHLCSASLLSGFDYRKLAAVKFGAGKSKYQAEVARWAKVLNARRPNARNTYATEAAA